MIGDAFQSSWAVFLKLECTCESPAHLAKVLGLEGLWLAVPTSTRGMGC